MTYSIGDPFGPTREAAPRSIQASIEIAATPDVVFRALADPRELVAWLSDAQSSDAPSRSPSMPSQEAASDGRDVATSPSVPFAPPRGGASWLARVRAPNGSPGTVSGEFLHVVPSRSLTTTWSASWHRFAQDTVTFDLAPVDVAGVAGTRVTVTHHRRADSLLRDATIASARSIADAEGDPWAPLLTRLATYVALTNAVSRSGIASEIDFTQAFGALHRRVIAIHQGDSA
jgi:uncharacterized protein YndB with AHSA1/START domain